MNKSVIEFIAELEKRLGVTPEYTTASHLYAWVEQKVRNEMVREGRRTGSCECCGSTQGFE